MFFAFAFCILHFAFSISSLFKFWWGNDNIEKGKIFLEAILLFMFYQGLIFKMWRT